MYIMNSGPDWRRHWPSADHSMRTIDRTEDMIDLNRFEVMSFDCYGTLIDWETGIVQALEPILRSHGLELTDDEILTAFAAYESKAQAPPYSTYREVLSEVLERIGRQYGFNPTPDDLFSFSTSVVDWPAFPDSKAALTALKQRYKLAIITNCDDDLFAESNRKLGVEFDWIVTAEQVGSYKPDERNFHVAFERLGLPRERILHVAQSLYHDHVTAKRLGLTTVWIDRRGDRQGSGATPVANATPDEVFPDMAAFAAAAV
jgi:2-haloacid dehalogenase